MTSVQRFAFRLVQQLGLSSGDVPSYRALQVEVVVIWSSVCSTNTSSNQPAEPGRPGVIPACSMQPASRPEASWPSALPVRSIHVTPHRIARLECLYPLLVSSRQLKTTCPLLPHLLVSLGSAPGSRVARPRRNTATFASPPWLLLLLLHHGQWHMSSRLGADKRLYTCYSCYERASPSLPCTLPAG